MNGRKVHYKKDLDKALDKSNGEPLNLIIRRNGKEETIIIDPMVENIIILELLFRQMEK